MYTAAAVAVLGLGLGAAATVFAVADSVLLSQLPYRDPGRLVRVGQLYQQNSTVWQLSTVDAQAILEQQRSFVAFGLVAWSDAALSRAGTPERASIGRATAGFFRVLEIDAAAGRVIAPIDELPGAPPVAVVSHALAERRLGGVGAAVGRALTIDGLSHTVIGVLPPGMDRLGGVRATAWPVLKLQPPKRRGPFWLRGIGRLREGVSLDAAARDMAAIGDRIFPLWASSFPDETARITPMPLRDTIVGRAGRGVGLFFAAVVLVLLVAMANVTTLSLARASEIPGVSGVGIASALPPDDNGSINNFNLIDRPVPPGVAEHLAPWSFVTPGYFDALGIPLLEGRMFTDADSGEAPPVVLVSRWWAENYYPGETAVGRQMVEGGCTSCPPPTVIGVVGDVKYLGLRESGDAVYSPLVQSQARTAHLVVRTRDFPAATFQALRDVVAGLDSELPVVEQTMVERLDRTLSGPARTTAVLAAFAVAAVALAAVGIFGLLSYTVGQRRREIGVRMALGADPSIITQMVVVRGIRYAAVGTVVGLGLTLLEARWLEAFLFGVSATDPLATLAAE